MLYENVKSKSRPPHSLFWFLLPHRPSFSYSRLRRHFFFHPLLSSILSLRLFSFSLFFSLLSFFSFYHSFSPFFFPYSSKTISFSFGAHGGKSGRGKGKERKGRRKKSGKGLSVWPKQTDRAWKLCNVRHSERDGEKGRGKPVDSVRGGRGGEEVFQQYLNDFSRIFCSRFSSFLRGKRWQFSGLPVYLFFLPPSSFHILFLHSSRVPLTLPPTLFSHFLSPPPYYFPSLFPFLFFFVFVVVSVVDFSRHGFIINYYFTLCVCVCLFVCLSFFSCL